MSLAPATSASRVFFRATALLPGWLLLCVAMAAGAATPVHIWSQGRGDVGNDTGKAVAVDGFGNVLFTGDFSNTVTFGGPGLVSAGLTDIFIVKTNSAGALQWSMGFGGTSSDAGNAVAVDGAGNVLVAGQFTNTVNFGGANLVSAGNNDIFVAKFSAAGFHLWSQRFGSTLSDIGYGVAVDASGNVLVAGQFVGTVNFGGVNLVSAGGADIFLAKYDAFGVHQWSTRFGGTSGEIGNGVAVDGSGNVLIVGQFAGTVNFGGGNLVSAGSNDVFVAKYNSAGTHQWSQRFGAASSDIGNELAVDAAGNVLITGNFVGTVNFGGSNLVGAGSNDIFLARYDPSGTHVWSKGLGGTANDIAFDVVADGAGNASITGSFGGTVDFGGGNLVSAGGADAFLANYDAAGAHRWSRSFAGAAASETGNGVAVDASGRVLVTGQFESSPVNFGGGDIATGGLYDIFLAKYGVNAAEPVITSIEDIGNDQGGRVRIAFARSGHDDPESGTPIGEYEAWRRIDPLAAALSTHGTRPPTDAALPPGSWELAAAIPAHAEANYFMPAPTVADSTAINGQHFSVFYVRAVSASPFFDSPIDSGYSLDNLAPGVPTSFAYNSGELTWDRSAAADFAHFTVYGGSTSSFSTATLIDYTTSPTLDVHASPYAFYFVTATDESGNEGKPAMIGALSGEGETPSRYVLSVSAYPNPFNPATTIRYTLPARQTVTLTIHDVRGARVATLIDNEEVSAGPHALEWNAVGDSGARVGSGVYFARVVSGGNSRSYKLVLLK